MTLTSLPDPPIALPELQLPTIRLPIHIPQVGCPGADARSYIGEQFGSLPDLYDALHIKHLRKVVNDQIYALIKGKLPTVLRAVQYAIKAVELINYVIEILQVLNQVIAQCIAEYNATIAFINQKKVELQDEITALEAIPANARLAVHELAIQRKNEYLGELDQQIGRLQTSISCIMQIG